MLVFLAVIQLPYVQNQFFKYFLEHFSAKTQFSIKHNYFRCKWFSQIVIKGFEIKDPSNQVLLAMKDLKVRINPISLLLNPGWTLETLSVDGAQVYLIKKQGEKDFTGNVFLQNLKKNDQQNYPIPVKSQPWWLKQIHLNAIEVCIDNQDAPKLGDTLNLDPIAVEQLVVQLANLRIDEHGVGVEIKHTAGVYKNQQLNLESLYGYCKVTSNRIQFFDLNLKTGYSHIKGNIQINYDNINTSARFIEQVYGIVHLEEATVHAAELSKFFPYFEQYADECYVLSGKASGKLHDFAIDTFRLRFGQQQSHFQGHVHIRGSLPLSNAFFSVNVGQSCFAIEDLLPYMPAQYHKHLAPLKACVLQGNFFGTVQNFISQADFKTEAGKLAMDVEVKMDPDLAKATYRGTISTDQLEVGTLLANDKLQKLTMQAQIAGHGLTLATAAIHVKGHIAQVYFNRYPYKNIYTDGNFEQAFFSGKLKIADPNLNFQADATIDWREAIKTIAIKGELKQAELARLHITEQEACLSTKLEVSAQGSSLDDLNTDAVFSQLTLESAEKPLSLEKIHIYNIHEKGYNKFALNSEVLNITAEGAFTYTALVHDIQQFIQSYQARLLTQTHFQPQYTHTPYTFSCAVDIKAKNPLWKFLMPGMYATSPIVLTGNFEKGDTIALNIEIPNVDTLLLQDNQWDHTCLSVQASQLKDGSRLSAMGRLSSVAQQWKGKYKTSQLALGIVWDNEQILLTNSLQHPEQPHKLAIQGKASLRAESIQCKLEQADIQIADCLWQIHPDNLFLLRKTGIESQNAFFSYQNQKISLEGTWSFNLAEHFKIGFHEVSLDHFNPLLSRKISGTVNGSIALQGSLKSLFATSDIRIREIYIGELLVGELLVKAGWNMAKEQIDLLCQVIHPVQPKLYIQGAYIPASSEKSLDLVAKFSKAQLGILEPFLGNWFSELGGEIDGHVAIQGSLAKPELIGELRIDHATVKSNYLNTLYHCAGTIYCDKDVIYTEGFNIQDDQKGKAIVWGSIKPHSFKNIQFDLQAKLDNFKLLETTSENNNYFYGTGILNGEASLLGPSHKPMINVKATTRSGTNLNIPIQRYGKQVSQEDYIKFVDLQAPKIGAKKKVYIKTIKGLRVNIDLEVTPEAWTSIILNRDNGEDIMQARGNAKLSIGVDEEGALSMTGYYELVEGKYSFSIYNMVKKQFKILEGSSITWYGKPDEGILHVQAAYEQRVGLMPILKSQLIPVVTQGSGNRGMGNKYPVSVILMLKGPLLKPDIKFKIEFQELPQEPDAKAAINNFLARTEEGGPYLMNQVFSLVILKRFFSQDLAVGTTLGRSVGEVFSQYLNSFLSQLDDNLEIDTDIDLADLNQGARIKLGYNLLGGRLKVMREGLIYFQNEKEIDVANLVGDWTMEYMLTTDNRLRIKIYNKHIHTYEEKATSITFAGGLSLRYVKSFNWWRELTSTQHKIQRKD
jgi:hypothetical protein